MHIVGTFSSGKAVPRRLDRKGEYNPGIRIDYDHAEHLLSVSAARGGSVVAPGEGDFFYDHGQSIWLEAQADPGFLFAGWSGTYSTAENPLLVTMDGEHYTEATFVSTLDCLSVDDDASFDAGPGDPLVRDPEEDGTTEHPFDSHVTVLNSILWNNLQSEILSTGTSTPDIRYCAIRGGWTGWTNMPEGQIVRVPSMLLAAVACSRYDLMQ